MKKTKTTIIINWFGPFCIDDLENDDTFFQQRGLYMLQVSPFISVVRPRLNILALQRLLTKQGLLVIKGFLVRIKSV